MDVVFSVFKDEDFMDKMCRFITWFAICLVLDPEYSIQMIISREIHILIQSSKIANRKSRGCLFNTSPYTNTVPAKSSYVLCSTYAPNVLPPLVPEPTPLIYQLPIDAVPPGLQKSPLPAEAVVS